MNIIVQYAIYYSVQFFLGGAIVVGITMVAKHMDPKYTGIIYAFPVILTVAIIFIYIDQGVEISRKALSSMFVYELTLVYFILALYLLLQKIDFWVALGLTVLSWLIIAILIQFWLEV